MSDYPLVTIYVSSYNHEKYIEQCLSSLINQTYPNIEIFIQDDCSTDGSVVIIDTYVPVVINEFGQRKVTLLPREQHLGIEGIYPSLNNAIYTANGKYFYRVDSDDFIEPDYISRLVEVAEKDGLDWVCGNLKIVDAESRVKELWDYRSWDTSKNACLLRGWERASVLLPHNGIFRTKFLTDNNITWKNLPYGWGADVKFTIDCVLCNPKVALIGDTHFCWRIHGNNNSSNVQNRIKLVIATKKYYMRHVEPEIYLPQHAHLLNRYGKLTKEYISTHYGLVAHDLFLCKQSFGVPSFLRNKETDAQIIENLHLFDQEILVYARMCLNMSDVYKDDMNYIMENINKTGKV